MNQIPFQERVKVYTRAFLAYGDTAQMIVALEELSELQKEICKILRGGTYFSHLAEEIADVSIMLEQLCLMFGIHTQVDKFMDTKVLRLDERLKEKYGEQ